ncbi:TPA: flagellar filament capping protein FliD [Clostridioides difficile]|uniref:flagellar filament capping protein FliD n=1 Tax=Clostridioides difficile TaxID=1496 RepID=UPI00097FE870|nr:flagellar filament capping protein FliD [Clostridioides difficile]MBY2229675.1 flagellar filament capping protein FliD [Clostridioides difficile]MCI9995846.1 flagellar filament capping protein FliD [Clostridioides difficile]MDW0089173.1 flagellar filament capping protein FliD [Clostridioides difficile]SJO97637.1 flagellar capping protein [Clostridioides difficile]SJT28184.1 flagellar capping protein [Clostridioides difficile]
MSSINPIRVTGLSGNFDMEGIIEASLIRDKEKINKAKQNQQIVKWKQEIYRDVIKESKNLYDKYLSPDATNCITNAKAYSATRITSSDESIIVAKGSAGAEKINYQFAVSQMAEPAKVTIKLNSSDPIVRQFPPNASGASFLNIGGVNIPISEQDTTSSIVSKINYLCTDNDIRASYSEMTGELIISRKQTGSSSDIDLKVIGNDSLAGQIASDNGITFTTDASGTKSAVVYGKNLEADVTDDQGRVTHISKEQNSFKIDNIDYNVNSKGSAKLLSVTDTEEATKNMKAFVDDYNALMDKVYGLVTTKKSKDYPPLTDEQKEDMTTEEIEKWEKKAKQGILRNDDELRAFVEDIQSMFFGEADTIIALRKLGISEAKDYNKKGQISFNADTFSKAIIDDSDKVYKTLAGYSSNYDDKGMFEKLKDIVYEYSGSSTSKFNKKAGMENSSAASQNVYSKQIAEQERNISRLVEKMNDKEKRLYAKYSALESLLNQYSSQMNYFSQAQGN